MYYIMWVSEVQHSNTINFLLLLMTRTLKIHSPSNFQICHASLPFSQILPSFGHNLCLMGWLKINSDSSRSAAVIGCPLGGNQETWISCCTLPWTSYVTLGRCLSFSGSSSETRMGWGRMMLSAHQVLKCHNLSFCTRGSSCYHWDHVGPASTLLCP